MGPNLDDGIFAVNTDVYGVVLDDPETLVGYIIDDDQPAIIEPGTAHGVDRLVNALTALDIPPESITHIVVGHYHIDHSGGVPGLLAAAPNATWYAHEEMVEWMTDPELFDRLVTSSKESLGAQFDTMGAPDRPLDPERLQAVGDDGTTIDTGARTLEIMHTPGHTADHISAAVPEQQLLFANEALGRYFPKTDVFHPPITVPAFDIEATRESIARLAAGDWERIAFSHAAVRSDPETVFETAVDQLDRFVDRVPAIYDATDEDLTATIERVRSELLGLDGGYPEAIAASQAEVCTKGLLRSVGRL